MNANREVEIQQLYPTV